MDELAAAIGLGGGPSLSHHGSSLLQSPGMVAVFLHRVLFSGRLSGSGSTAGCLTRVFHASGEQLLSFSSVELLLGRSRAVLAHWMWRTKRRPETAIPRRGPGGGLQPRHLHGSGSAARSSPPTHSARRPALTDAPSACRLEPPSARGTWWRVSGVAGGLCGNGAAGGPGRRCCAESSSVPLPALHLPARPRPERRR